MTATLRLQASVQADGAQAAAELERLGGKLAQNKRQLADLGKSSRDAAQQLKALETAGRGASAEAEQLKTSLASLAAREVQLKQDSQAAAAALRELGNAQNRVANSAGQVRASTAQLGQQINDVAQGIAAGTAASTIFAQQIGQVAFAMSGLNGAAGKLGAFLSGPWGAVLTGAAIITGSLADAFFRSQEAAEEAAAGKDKNKTASEKLAEATEELNRLTGIEKQTVEEALRAKLNEMNVIRQREIEKRKELKTQIEINAAQTEALKIAAINSGQDPAAALLAVGLSGLEGEDLAAKLREVDKTIADAEARLRAGRREVFQFDIGRAIQAEMDAAARATQTYTKELVELNRAHGAGLITDEAYASKRRDVEAALKASKDAARDAAASKRGLAKDVREAAAEYEALVTAAERARFAIAGTTFAGVTSGGQAGQSIGVGAAEILARAEKERLEKLADTSREDTGLARVMKDFEDKLPQVGEEVGERAGEGFRRRALTDAVAIGQAIGGAAGNVLSSFAGALQGAATGDFTGLGGRFGGVLTLLAGRGGRLTGLQRAQSMSAADIRRQDAGLPVETFQDGFREVFSRPLENLGRKFTEIFKDNGDFARTIGKAAGGAATGTLVGELGSALGLNISRGGAQVGGAIGGAVFGPLGGLLGSLAGGLIGGLFAKSGSTTVSSTGNGQITQTGTGNAGVQRATAGLGNTISDTIQGIAEALGADVGAFSVSIGKRGKSFRVDTSGSGRIRGSTVTATNDEREALSLAVADALRDGAIVASPRVQTALRRYATDVNKAVAEALKVQGLEELLASRDNPFSTVFRRLEDQIRDRLRVASDYGFDLVQIEEINGEERARVLRETLQSTTGSIRQLLDDLQFGSRATGSVGERLAGLTAERDRVSALARAGDTSQLDVLANIVSQIDDLQRQAFGATAPAAEGRAESIALLNELISQTEARIQAAADAARADNDRTFQKLTEANASLDDMVNLMGQNNALLAQLAQQGFGGFPGLGLDLAGLYAR